MVGRVDKEGLLWLTRKGKLTQQLCPFGSGSNPCGDHCPHFCDPKENRVTICHNNTLLGIADEREEYIAPRKHCSPTPPPEVEKQDGRKGGARKGAGRRKKYWGVRKKGDGILICPDCFSEATAINEPTHCPHCRVRLHLPEE